MPRPRRRSAHALSLLIFLSASSALSCTSVLGDYTTCETKTENSATACEDCFYCAYASTCDVVVGRCLADPACKKALSCLEQCSDEACDSCLPPLEAKSLQRIENISTCTFGDCPNVCAGFGEGSSTDL